MDARYYDSGIGRFVSQDPEFWKMSKLDVLLVDPQSWDSYAYARNNPLVLLDLDGNFPISFQEYRYSINTALTFIKSAANSAWNYANESISLNSPQFGSKEYSQKVNEGLKYGGAYLGTKSNGQDVYMGVGPSSIESVAGSAGKVANGLRIGEKIPSLGKVIENASGKIEGFNHDGTYHGLDQIISRGVTPQTIADTVKNPLARFAGRFERIGYLSKESYVVLSKTGQVVTSWTKNEFGSTIKNVLNRIAK